jgi:O-acetyl-ADP-ribose deacetylase (regulator of RNase III)
VKETLFDGRLTVTSGDITLLHVDAIVNAANSSLMGGGGVDGAIHRAGGPSILEACRDIRRTSFPDGLPTGEAVETTAGLLHAKWVIHTVGPVWWGGSHGESQQLASCYSKSLQLAARLGAESIAFPAVSTGVYRYPRDLAAKVVWEALSSHFAANPRPASVVLVFFKADDARVFLPAAGASS